MQKKIEESQGKTVPTGKKSSPNTKKNLRYLEESQVKTVPTGKKSSPDTKKKENLRYLRDKDREKVKGIFRSFEVPGGSVSFPFRKYKEDPVEYYTLVDGHQYTLPLGVARHLNTNCSYPVHQRAVDENGKPIARIGKKVRRYAFQSLEFIDIDEFPNNADEIVTVEKI